MPRVNNAEPSSYFTTFAVVSYNIVPCFLVKALRFEVVSLGIVILDVLEAVPPSISLAVIT